MPTFGPDRASCEVLVFREGLLAAVGHDLLLRATDVEIAVDEGERAVTARVGAGSLRIVTALRDGKPLPGALQPAEVQEIEGATASLLRTDEFPDIRFTSGEVARRGDGFDVRGSLALAGKTRAVAFAVRRDGERLEASVTLHQPDFGIRPYRALLGSLRVKPDVVVRVSLRSPASSPAS